MKTLIIFDSQFGNTEKIAQMIAAELGGEDNTVRLVRVNSVSLEDLIGLDLLVVGSPTQRWNTTEAMTRFLQDLPPNFLNHVRAAAFDTRLRARLGGSAAVKIERLLKAEWYPDNRAGRRLLCTGEDRSPGQGRNRKRC